MVNWTCNDEVIMLMLMMMMMFYVQLRRTVTTWAVPVDHLWLPQTSWHHRLSMDHQRPPGLGSYRPSTAADRPTHVTVSSTTHIVSSSRFTASFNSSGPKTTQEIHNKENIRILVIFGFASVLNNRRRTRKENQLLVCCDWRLLKSRSWLGRSYKVPIIILK